ncbi:MAG: 2-C-methyl-D-erythritol 2,4-cyclodiphosphate synthase [Symbiobacteriia bacterium]
MYVGFGYDVHRLEPGRLLILGGVQIPHERGLLGHSDADVLIHAIMDAILGAMGERDIGHQFPNTDPRFAGASSLALLAGVVAKMTAAGYRLRNVDSTVLAEEPKLSPYTGQMRENLAEVLGLPAQRVSIKATTNEGMGFVGRREGIAAYAVALLEEAARAQG